MENDRTCIVFGITFLKELEIKRRCRFLLDLPLVLALLVYNLKRIGISVNTTPMSILKWAYVAIVELDYNVRPVTVLYTLKEGKPAIEKRFYRQSSLLATGFK